MSDSEAAIFASQHLFDYVGNDPSSSSCVYERNSLGNYMLYSVPGATYTPSGNSTGSSSTMSGSYLVNTDGKLNPDAKLLYYDNWDNHFLKNARTQEHTISASGASDKIDYFMSLGYLQDPSYIQGSSFERYNTRSKINAQITDWLKAGINMTYSYRKTQSPATRYGRNPGSAVANVFRWINGQNQLIPLYTHSADGSYILDSNGDKIFTESAGQTYSALGQTSAPLSTANLEYILNNDKDISTSNDLNTIGHVEAKFLKDFTANANISYNSTWEKRERYWNTVSGGAVSYDGALGYSDSEIHVLNTQQTINWNHDYNLHHVDAMIGHEYNNYKYFVLNWKGSNSLIEGFDSFANFKGLNYKSTFSNSGGSENETALEGYFARVNYIFNNKYYAQGSLREDGSSKFKDSSKRWGLFWSLGGGWRVSSESFMASTKSWLNDFKIRGSYGIIGNQNGVSNYSGYQTWSLGVSDYSYSGASYYPNGYTLKKGSFVNDQLTWEKVHTIDLGADIRLFDRISANLDYYNRKTKGMIWSQPIAYSLGQSSLSMNNAEMKNWGIEADISVDIITQKDLQWTVSLNGTHYKTILTKVPAGVGSDALNGNWTAGVDSWSAGGTGGTGSTCYLRGIGKDYYNLYFYKYAGVDQSTGLPLFWSHDSENDTDTKTTDYSTASRYECGSAIPKVIGGFGTTLTYKNFDFSALCSFQLGGKFMSVEYANGLYRSENIGTALSKELIGNTWTPDNTNAKFPMQMYTGDTYGGGSTIGSWAYTDMALFSASYLSIKNIVFGYTLPSRWISKYHLSNVRFYASGDNMFMFTKHAGYDPRMSLDGGLTVAAYTYPYMRTMSVGVKITL